MTSVAWSGPSAGTEEGGARGGASLVKIGRASGRSLIHTGCAGRGEVSPKWSRSML